ncbi:hypothetical protein FRB94_002909 [Tulasnella sp. JGI-2019a]|nr:hypothetical protein FRB93_013929 [Tulasnella sp. JGI-2019a]KAG9013381.1 hypothetical protein FRB94_002909 [Tulasnella sp. JGI-2019a]
MASTRSADNDLLAPQERPAKRPRPSVEPVEQEGNVQAAGSGEAPVGDEEEGEDEEDPMEAQDAASSRRSDLYLDTVNRQTLDFDFEKVCSISLSNINVYGCLVCGKYFQGRGKSTFAYAHSIHEDHHVFLNLETQKVYILPDGYEVHDPSLDDIAAVLAPVFTPAQVAELSSPSHIHKLSYDLSSKPYLPGFVGLNNIKRNDYLNVVIHVLAHITPLRDFFLLFKPIKPAATVATTKGSAPAAPTARSSELLNRFAALVKKLWNPRLFKAQVSPHDFLQEVVRASGGKFKITEQGDPVDFLGWLLNHLHVDLGGSKKRSSVVHATLQGNLKVESQQVVARPDWEGNQRTEFRIDEESKIQRSPFLFLSVDLPPPPLFQDAVEKNIIPQVSLASVLAKYDGKTVQESGAQVRRFKCEKLPPFIILHFKRFTKNMFVEEKNPTIVNFPLKGIDFSPYVETNGSPPNPIPYDLVSNVVHESTAGTTRDKANTVWKVQLRAGRVGGSPVASTLGTGAGAEDEKWFQLQDLVVEEVQKEMIFLGETVLQVWQRRDITDTLMRHAA